MLNDPNAVPFLVRVLENGPDWTANDGAVLNSDESRYYARCLAVEWLGRIGDKRAYAPLVKALDEKTPASVAPFFRGETFLLRAYAVLALGYLGDPNAIKVLTQMLQEDASDITKAFCMYSLARFNDRSVIPLFVKVAAENLSAQGRLPGALSNTFDLCMRSLTRKDFQIKYSGGKYTSTAYPELGEMVDPFLPVWQHWLRVGRAETMQEFQRLNAVRKDAVFEAERSGARQRMGRDLSVAALPMLVDAIKAGETELIEQVSILTSGEVSKEANREDVLKWWAKNSERWLIPFEDEPRIKIEDAR